MAAQEIAVVAAVAAVIAGGCAARFYLGAERSIRRQLARIEEESGKEPAEPPEESANKARRLALLFHDPCTLSADHVGYQGNYTRAQLEARIMRWRSVYSWMAIHIDDIVITTTGNREATLHCTVHTTGEGSAGEVDDSPKVCFKLRKIRGRWLFTALTLLEAATPSDDPHQDLLTAVE
ncbi:MAG: hypothetical protein ACOX5Z_01045 [Desulfobulbus sp.]